MGKEFVGLRENMIKDIKLVGKELALDIVSLNKKIDARNHHHNLRFKTLEETM